MGTFIHLFYVLVCSCIRSLLSIQIPLDIFVSIIIVLINNGSASASEIFAGALKDHKRAIILGENSYGKGSVQSIVSLNNGGGIRLTISKYYLPSGNSISEIGVAPDILVEETDDDFKINSENDNQLNYALKLFNS